MSDKISEDRLIHYFAGECSEEEAARIEAWINADPNRRRRVARLREIWEAADRPHRSRPDVDAMWEDLARRLGPSELAPEASGPDDEEGSDRGQRRRRRTGRRPRGARWPRASVCVSAMAVFVAVLVATAWVLFEYEQTPRGPWADPGGASMRTLTTDAGQRARIELSDGTRVTLNAESKLTMPPEFGEERREVTLRGQAYFEVEPDEERPFFVRAGGSVTRVLGTKFEVGAYPEDEEIRVVVAEGKVAVRAEEDRAESSVTLRERQMASLSKSDRSMVRREVDPAPYLAWTEGQLVFRDAPFAEVIRRLENWYDLRVTLNGSPDAVDRLNTTFGDEPVGEVLSIVAETLDLRYERDGKSVTFFVRDEDANE